MEYNELMKFLEGCRRIDTSGESCDTLEPFKDTKGEEVTKAQFVQAVPFRLIAATEELAKQGIAKRISEHVEGKEHVIVRMMPRIVKNENCDEQDEDLPYRATARIIAY